MRADEYAKYTAENPTAEHKKTQKAIKADKGNTITVIFTWLLEMFGDEHNREALVQWIVDFFDLKSGAEETVRWLVNELFNQSQINNTSDIIVSALFHGLGVTVVISDAFLNNAANIQKLLKQLYGVIGDNSGSLYGNIARVMEDLTHVWEATVGPEEDYDEAVDKVEENLNWFQRLFKKIKEFFQKIFGIFG